MLFQGRKGVRTRIVSAYRPCRASDDRLQTSFTQQKRWLRLQGDNTNPREVAFLAPCRERKERIVLLIDANEDTRQGPLSLALSDLDLTKGITNYHSTLDPPSTHRKGNKPIDGIFITPEIQLPGAGFLGMDQSIGDHRAMFINVEWESLLGQSIFKVPRPPACQLSTRIPRAAKTYARLLKK